MLKIVCPGCCGMDEHKSFLVACIASYKCAWSPLHHRREKPCAKLPYRFQHQAGRCGLQCFLKGHFCYYVPFAGSAKKLTDVSAFRTKGIKATDEQVLVAVDGEMYSEQKADWPSVHREVSVEQAIYILQRQEYWVTDPRVI